MAPLDLGILALVGLGAWRSFRGGFTQSISGIVAVLGGIFIASKLWRKLSALLEPILNDGATSKWASVIFLAVGGSLLINFVIDRFDEVINKGAFGMINSAVGAGFGGLVSCLIIGSALILLHRVGGETVQAKIDGSTFAPIVMSIARGIFDFGKGVVKDQTFLDPPTQ